MGIIEFLGLFEEEQWEEFHEQGIFVTKYKDVDVNNYLYRLHDFYVELSTDATPEIHHVMNAFITGPRLDKYIENELLYVTETLNIELP